MQLITENSQLIAGREYWARDKRDGAITLERCESEEGRQYVGRGRFWAMDTNNQALARWDLVGPVPLREAPDFAAFGVAVSMPADRSVE